MEKKKNKVDICTGKKSIIFGVSKDIKGSLPPRL